MPMWNRTLLFTVMTSRVLSLKSTLVTKVSLVSPLATMSKLVHALPSNDGEEASTDFSGKVGAVTELTEKVEVYGEYSFITGDELSSGVKAGATYRF